MELFWNLIIFKIKTNRTDVSLTHPQKTPETSGFVFSGGIKGKYLSEFNPFVLRAPFLCRNMFENNNINTKINPLSVIYMHSKTTYSKS